MLDVELRGGEKTAEVMNWKRTSDLIIIFATFMLAVLDVGLLFFGGVEATFSRRILNVANVSVPFVFAAGFLCGHIFWAQRPKS